MAISLDSSLPDSKYSVTARLLHWVSAALIIWATLSGLSVSLLDVNENWLIG